MPPFSRVQLLVPCLVEDCLPEIGEAVVAVLEHLGLTPELPPGQTCCGQMAYKSGDWGRARTLALRVLDIFSGPSGENDPVVCPSGSCVKMVHSYPELFEPGSADHARALALAARTHEFCAFLVDVLGREDLGARFAAKACFHASCQVEQLGRVAALDEGREGQTPALRLLAGVRGLTVVQPERADRCCGFGGLFSVQFPALSESLVEDKAHEILETGAGLVVSAEPSCLMNIGGYLARLGKDLPALHVAQVLAAGLPGALPKPGGRP